MSSQYDEMPNYTKDHPSLLRKVITITRNIMKGKLNNADTVTLTANSATTTVSVAEGILSTSTVIVLMPTTANAKAEGTPYYSVDVTNSQFTLNHTNNAQTDRTYGYVIIG